MYDLPAAQPPKQPEAPKEQLNATDNANLNFGELASVYKCKQFNCVAEPEVIDLIQIVVPRVHAHWRDVAFALYYKIPIVKGIEVKHKQDPEESCKGLFEDWLSTNNGAHAGPKTWATLLGAIEKVHKLAKAREEILQELAIRGLK